MHVTLAKLTYLLTGVRFSVGPRLIKCLFFFFFLGIEKFREGGGYSIPSSGQVAGFRNNLYCVYEP